MENLGVVYEVDCNNCLKMYTGETGRKVKERMKEHKNDGEKIASRYKHNCPFTTYQNHWPLLYVG